jgi:hypothetical protein
VSTTAATLGSGGTALLCLTLICWSIQIVYLFGVTGQQAHGDAVVGQAFSFFAAIAFAALTWLWLGGLLLKAGTEGILPPWAQAPAIVLYLASGAAAAAAFVLIQDPHRIWPAFIPGLIPPILAFYVLVLYLPILRSGTVASLIAGAAVTILSLAPWPSLFRELTAAGERRVARVQAQQQWQIDEKARNRAENLPKIQAMSPDVPLMNWYPLLDEKNGVRPEALEALRHVERRQPDIEDMLSYGIVIAMLLLPDLDLQPTPQLCEAARTFMLKNAKESRVRPKQDPTPYDGAYGVAEFAPGIHWLTTRGCDCDEGIAALRASVESHLDSPDRKKALAALADLPEKH